jgi:hypothetical protein
MNSWASGMNPTSVHSSGGRAGMISHGQFKAVINGIRKKAKSNIHSSIAVHSGTTIVTAHTERETKRITAKERLNVKQLRKCKGEKRNHVVYLTASPTPSSFFLSVTLCVTLIKSETVHMAKKKTGRRQPASAEAEDDW